MDRVCTGLSDKGFGFRIYYSYRGLKMYKRI